MSHVLAPVAASFGAMLEAPLHVSDGEAISISFSAAKPDGSRTLCVTINGTCVLRACQVSLPQLELSGLQLVNGCHLTVQLGE